MMTIKINLCNALQLDLLRDISMETYRDTFSASNSEQLMQQYFSDALSKAKLQQQLSNPHSFFYFIYVNNQAAGFMKINEQPAQSDKIAENSLEIERLYIRKDYFKQGLGKQLISFACEIATQRSCSCVWLGVWEGNIDALAFYHKQGFYQVGQHPFDMGGEIQTDLILLKTFNSTL